MKVYQVLLVVGWLALAKCWQMGEGIYNTHSLGKPQTQLQRVLRQAQAQRVLRQAQLDDFHQQQFEDDSGYYLPYQQYETASGYQQGAVGDVKSDQNTYQQERNPQTVYETGYVEKNTQPGAYPIVDRNAPVYQSVDKAQSGVYQTEKNTPVYQNIDKNAQTVYQNTDYQTGKSAQPSGYQAEQDVETYYQEAPRNRNLQPQRELSTHRFHVKHHT